MNRVGLLLARFLEKPLSHPPPFDAVDPALLHACLRPGDVLLGFTTSGNSANVLEAMRAARERGMRVFGLLGRDGGEALVLCDRSVVVPARDAGRVQEVHIKVVHALIELIERELHPENYSG